MLFIYAQLNLELVTPSMTYIYPPRIKLVLQDREEALKPYFEFSGQLARISQFLSEHSLENFGDIQLQLVFLGITPHAIPARQPEFQKGLRSFQFKA